ncbi:MAG TPA: methylmalonyl-CoA mutase family protein [Thermodesulfobacteriota bacterium]|nr:methylmalonyl-CoA mutase family protein [Thermodesulfobacteriota bacterium]
MSLEKRTSKELDRARKYWEEEYRGAGKREADYTTISGMEVPPLATPLDLNGFDYEDKLGFPGSYPFTRGIHSTMYRGRLWTMRQFAGFGSPEDTNRRFKYLMDQGQTGLSTAFDMPTLMGYDSDHERSKGEVGREGVSVSSLQDMEVLFDGIDLGKVTTSMTINCSASIIFAMYLVMAGKKGVSWGKLRGTLQNDMLKEFIAQREWISPPEPSVKIVIDIIEFCAKEVPNWHPVSISGYHIREAGSTAVQELAFTLADGIGYVEESLKRGLDVDEFAPRLSFFFNVHNDFLEEVAKFRAARRMWARIMKERFGAKDQKSLILKTHAQTAGASLTAQQPLNNIARVTIQALAAVLGGTQSLHTNSMDETLALPTEEAVTVALRTQQIIAEESGVVNSIDPFGGSYVIESMTDTMEKEAYAYIEKIDELGGIIKAIETGYPQKEIADAAYKYQRELDAGIKTIVGVNKYTSEQGVTIPTLKIEDTVETGQSEKLRELKRKRNNKVVQSKLRGVVTAARRGDNLMPYIIEAVSEYATLGEICDIFREVYGVYRDPGYY